MPINNGRDHSALLQFRRMSSSPPPPTDETPFGSYNFLVETEIIIALTSGSEYHKITHTSDHPSVEVHAKKVNHLELVKEIKPNLNLSLLKHIPLEKSVESILSYYDFR